MGKLAITDFMVYKKRYALGLAFVVVVLILLLGVVAFLVPNGVSSSEMKSVVDSSAIQYGTAIGKYPDQIAHAPYHLLQRASTELLGVSTFSIKLPSLILAFLSILALYGVLRLWFRRNVAIITSIIAMTTAQFLLLAQLGTPRISYIFLSISLLFCASMLTLSKNFRSLWIIAAAIIAAVSLYSPLQFYIVIGLFVIALIHPHSRFILYQTQKWAILTGTLVFIALITPLALSIVAKPSLLLRFIGLRDDLSGPSVPHLQELVSQYVGFTSSLSTETVAPAYGLGVILLVCIGAYRLFSAKYTAKSYIITGWLVILIPAVLFFPTATTLTFIPLILLTAFAFDYLIRSWYGLFPRNPYARIAGLIPLSILIITLSLSNISRFVYGYHYDKGASAVFSHDLNMVQAQTKPNDEALALLVPSTTQDFYRYYAHTQKNTKLTVLHGEAEAISQLNAGKKIMVGSEYRSQIKASPSSILVDDTTDNGARFYIYKKTSQ